MNLCTSGKFYSLQNNVHSVHLRRTMGELRTIVRVRAEGLAVILKTSVTFAVLYLDPLGHKPTALAAFALGQLTYALVLLFIYVIHYGVGELRVSRAVDSRYELYSSLQNCSLI